MIVICNVYCQSSEAQRLEDMGLDDPGMWLPFAFDMDTVVAVKQSSDEESHMTYKCATIFTEQGDAFVTDILFKKMLKQWKEYHESLYTIDDEDETEENNLIL